jgi:Family of unknown function (DUF6132)
MDFILKHKLTLAGIIAGAIGGYLYYSYIGCASGSCPITSQPINSTLYGAMMGGLFLNMFQKDKGEAEQK